MEIAIQIGLNAVIAGALYSLITIGFNLTYSTARFFDLSYGALAVVGAYFVFFFYQTLGYPLIPALTLAVALTALLGFATEKLLYRQLRIRKATPTVMLIASLGVLTVMQAFVAIIFTSQFRMLAKDAAGTVSLFGGSITYTQIFILAAALIVMLVLGVLLQYFRFGKAIRAIADDEEVAQIVGINSERVVGIVFAIGAAVAGAAGIAAGFDTGMQPTMGLSLLLKGVIAAVIGGVGNVYAGVAGAFTLALIENIGVWYISGEWKDAIAFAVLIIVLLVRPQGLFRS